jgi:protein-S-isoprenylcysteine O-methyltransferase Ste14
MDTEFLLFLFSLILELLLGTGLIVSFLFSKHRLWPPPQKGSWQYWYIHLFTETSIISFIALGILDWNTFMFSHWIFFLVALLLIVSGATLFFWALKTLTFTKSLGSKGKLMTTGPYKYSRNPQYVGLILFFSGTILFFNSFYVLIIGLIGNVWFLLAAFVEEPWLKEQFRKEYENYCKKVPRFF